MSTTITTVTITRSKFLGRIAVVYSFEGEISFSVPVYCLYLLPCLFQTRENVNIIPFEPNLRNFLIRGRCQRWLTHFNEWKSTKNFKITPHESQGHQGWYCTIFVHFIAMLACMYYYVFVLWHCSSMFGTEHSGLWINENDILGGRVSSRISSSWDWERRIRMVWSPGSEEGRSNTSSYRYTAAKFFLRTKPRASRYLWIAGFVLIYSTQLVCY